jgi:hypothetical protein
MAATLDQLQLGVCAKPCIITTGVAACHGQR